MCVSSCFTSVVFSSRPIIEIPSPPAFSLLLFLLYTSLKQLQITGRSLIPPCQQAATGPKRIPLSLRAAGSILSPTALIIPSRLWNEMNQNQFNAMYPPYCLLIELRIGISDATNLTALVGWTKPSSGPFINNSAILFFPFLFFLLRYNRIISSHP